MKNTILFIPILASFFVILFLLPFWIKKAKHLGLSWEDMNKLSKEKVAGSGGIIVVLGFIIGTFLFIAIDVFLLRSLKATLIEIFAVITVILILAGIGLFDDLFGWKKGGLRRRYRIILIAFAAIPLMAINAGRSDVLVPFIGSIELGLIYPLLIIPVGIIGATATFNFLAGFNGLEAGQGILILSALGIVAFFTGSQWLTIVALILIATLIAFLFYNFYPAKVFPGDSLTYPVGGMIAIMAILGNFEKIAVFFFIPYIIEFSLKLRGRFIIQSFGKPCKDGSLDLRYKKLCGVEHIAIWLMKKIKIKPTEKRVVFLIWAFQFIVIILGFIIFRKNIFQK